MEVKEVKAWWWCVNEERERERQVGMRRTGDQSINKLIN